MSSEREEPEVVVICPVTTYYYEEEGLHAARIAELGITSFGDTPEEAIEHLKRHFNVFIHALRTQGVLESTLNKLGVIWHWRSQYPEDQPRFEHTNKYRYEALRGALAESKPERWTRTEAPEDPMVGVA